jgi:hypothetical protein
VNPRKLGARAEALAEMSMTTDYDMRIVAPFSPSIIKATMPEAIVREINQRVDAIVEQRDEVARRDWSEHLAGVVTTEIRFTDVIHEVTEVRDFLYDVARTFAYRCENALMHYGDYERTEELASKKLEIQIKEGWINDMVAGDYNPAHFHQGCLFSSVGFLRVPPGYEEEFQADKARQTPSVACSSSTVAAPSARATCSSSSPWSATSICGRPGCSTASIRSRARACAEAWRSTCLWLERGGREDNRPKALASGRDPKFDIVIIRVEL